MPVKSLLEPENPMKLEACPSCKISAGVFENDNGDRGVQKEVELCRQRRTQTHGGKVKENSQPHGIGICSNVRLSCCSLRPTPSYYVNVVVGCFGFGCRNVHLWRLPALGTVLPCTFVYHAVCLTGLYCRHELDFIVAGSWLVSSIIAYILYCIRATTYHPDTRSIVPASLVPSGRGAGSAASSSGLENCEAQRVTRREREKREGSVQLPHSCMCVGWGLVCGSYV